MLWQFTSYRYKKRQVKIWNNPKNVSLKNQSVLHLLLKIWAFLRISLKKNLFVRLFPVSYWISVLWHNILQEKRMHIRKRNCNFFSFFIQKFDDIFKHSYFVIQSNVWFKPKSTFIAWEIFYLLKQDPSKFSLKISKIGCKSLILAECRWGLKARFAITLK